MTLFVKLAASLPAALPICTLPPPLAFLSSTCHINKPDIFFFFFFLTSLLEYNCFTMVC